MRKFKIIDLRIQLALIIISVPLILKTDDHLHLCYIAIGSWQLISLITHFIFSRHFLPSKERIYYCFILLIMLASTGLLFVEETGRSYLIFLFLVFIPAIMLWYVFICHQENKRLSHKDLVHLK